MCLNPFGTGQCLSTNPSCHINASCESQSLWNRAMSFDQHYQLMSPVRFVSIPLEQGNVFRRRTSVYLLKYLPSQSLWNRAMSFDFQKYAKCDVKSLNPFGTGQCLSTAVGC